MLGLLFSNPFIFLISFGGLILSLTCHEFAHALMADHLGDPTPRMQGRVTLNPLAHLDPLGTVAMLVTRFGWGKPVQFDPYNLKNPVRDAALIALAGPATNLLIAAVLSLVVNLRIAPMDSVFGMACIEMILINLVLAVFNLIPVHPLDGSKILLVLLPRDLAYEYETFMHQYGFFILIALIFPWYNGMAPIGFLTTPLLTLFAHIFHVPFF
jgi:Zn-dependent protease